MQTTVFFTFPTTYAPEPRRDSAAWRTAFVEAGLGNFADWNQIRVCAVRNLLWLISGSPAANPWLTARLDGVAGVVAGVVGDALSMEVRQRAVTVRHDAQVHAYRLPVWVAAKWQRGNDWAAQRAEPQPTTALVTMARTIERQLCRELRTWDVLPTSLAMGEPFLAIGNAGRALPVRAISAERSGHGKPMDVLVRRPLIFLSSWRLEGEFFAGPLASLGFGRVLRTRLPEQMDRNMQNALLDLTPTGENA